jgi:hypothetical protein
MRCADKTPVTTQNRRLDALSSSTPGSATADAVVRPEAPVQRSFSDVLGQSPKVMAQREAIARIHGSPAMVAQRKMHGSLFGAALAQRQAGIEEDAPLQALFGPAQRAGPGGDEMQMRRAPSAPAGPKPAAAPRRNDTGLPGALKSGIESISGMSLDKVKVHYNSAQPAQLSALAYAQGSDIHLAPGQERHLPHEAWHVVQQAQGRVRPTMQMKGGVPVNDDKGLEREADAMGSIALELAPLHRAAFSASTNGDRRAESVAQAGLAGGLNQDPSPVEQQAAIRSAPNSSSLVAQASRHKVLAGVPGKAHTVQRVEIPVSGGKFRPRTDDDYVADNEDNMRGAKMTLLFQPSTNLGALEVHLVQTVKDIISDQNVYDQLHQGNVGFGDRQIPEGEHQGWGIDMEFYQPLEEGGQSGKIIEDRKSKLDPNDPVHKRQIEADKKTMRSRISGVKPLNSLDPRYAQQRLGPSVPVYSKKTDSMTTGWSATRETEKKAWSPTTAAVRDNPKAPVGGGISGMEFEVAALAEGGTGGAKFVGSVTWGWSLGENGKSKVKPLELKDQGQASEAFFAAAAHFNKMAVKEDPADEGSAAHATMQLPLRK